jgi:glycerol 3-phosphatase-2
VSLASNYDLVIFDLDGVVYLGTQPVLAAPESIRATVEDGVPVAYVTNNASRSAADVASLLRSIEVPASPDEVFTAARAAAEMLATDLFAAAPVLVVGAQALSDVIREVGLTPVARADERPLAVVQGYGPQVGWPILAEACVAIRAGARWVATNRDATMPSPRGPLPGNGSLVAALSTALGGREPDDVVGKPEPALFQLAARHRGAAHVLVVGDRLDTDIEGSARAGMDGLLVLTGVSSPADILHAPVNQRPTHLAADLRALSTPDDAARVPTWANEQAVAGGWRVTRVGDRLRLQRRGDREDHGGHGDAGGGGRAGGEGRGGRWPGAAGTAVDVLRALAAAAWAHPEWTGITAYGQQEMQAIEALGLGHFTGWPVRAASEA